MISNPLLVLLTVGGVAVAATSGYFVGKSTATSQPRAADGAGGSGFNSSSSKVGGRFDTAGSQPDLASSRKTKTLLAVEKVSDTSWHEYTGPFTAESWMTNRLAILSSPLSQVRETLAQIAAMPPSEEQMRLQLEVLALWATQDPEAALDFSNDIDSRQQRHQARESILRVWAGSNPRLAFEWLESQNGVIPDFQYDRLFDDALRGYADGNLPDAIDYFNTLGESLDRRQKERGINEIVEAMIQQGRLDEATDLIGQFSDTALQNSASEELISELANVDVDEALELLSTFDGADNYIEMQKALVNEWAESSPEEVAAYLTENVDVGEGFSSMAFDVIRNWDDLPSASEWLAQYKPSPELDRPTMVLAFRASELDPEAALVWANNVTDERLERRALSVVASRWKATDEAGFNQYLERSIDLSEEQKKIVAEAPARTFNSGGRGGGLRGGGGRR